MVVVGTSLNVYPAASLIHYAPENCPIYFVDPGQPEFGISRSLQPSVYHRWLRNSFVICDLTFGMNPYIQSLRLRTLPLSVSGIILGTGLAAKSSELVTGHWSLVIFTLSILTTLSLQILSNLCNELGDAQKGTDADQSGREAYGLQSGALTERTMRRMIGGFIGLSVLFGSALVYMALPLWSTAFFVFFALGALAIIGAIKYTLGKHSYGYVGLGDFGVFVFFGLLSTISASTDNELGGFLVRSRYWYAVCGGAESQ